MRSLTEEGIDDEAILRALESFQGMGRRFDFLGEFPLEPVMVKAVRRCWSMTTATTRRKWTPLLKTARAGWPDKNLVMPVPAYR
ncbi:hypothetical protein ACLB1Q_16055 [Escherichia coli]